MKKLLFISLALLCLNTEAQDWQELVTNLEGDLNGLSLSQDQTLYAAIGNKMYQSTNQAYSWQEVSSSGLENVSFILEIVALTDHLIIRATNNNSVTPTLYKVDLSSLSIVQNQEPIFSGHPNPFGAELSVKSSQQDSKWLSVSDMNGKNIATIKDPDVIEKLDTKDWKSGSYIITDDSYNYFRVVKP